MNLLNLVLYLVSNILFALTLGILATKLRFSVIPKASLFFTGVAITPFVYGMVTLLLLCVPVHLPALLYTLFPIVTSLIILIVNHRFFRKIPDLISNLAHAQKNVALLSCVLFPLLCVSPFIVTYLQYKWNSTLVLSLCFVCGVFLAICGWVNLKLSSWVPLEREKRVLMFVLLAIVSIINVYVTLLATSSISMRKNLLLCMIAICVVILLAISLFFFFKHLCKVDSTQANRLSLYYGVFAFLVIILRFGTQIILYKVSNVNFSIALVIGFWVLSLGILCLVVYAIENTYPSKANKSQPVQLSKIARMVGKYAVISLSIIAIVSVILTLAIQSIAPVLGADATEYLTSASEIANTRTFASVNLYNGSANGSQIGVVHHPAWIAYLAQALMHSTSQPFGYPNDLAARAAFPLTYVYLFVAVYALARAFLPKRFSLLAVALAACTPQLGYLISLNSREGFRIIPILVLILVLYGYSQAVSKQRRVLWPELLSVFFVASFVMMGHVINAIPAAAIGLATAAFLILSKNFNGRTILMGCSAVLGGVFGCIQIPLGYLEHGKLLSDIISLDVMLAGTPYLKNFNVYQASRLGDTQTYLDRLNVLIRYDHGLLTAIGAGFGVLFLVLLIRAVRRHQTASIAGLIGLTGIFFAALFTDVFSWSGYTLSEWSVMNVRYLTHLYPIYAVLVAGGLYLLSQMQVKRTIVALGISAMLCCYAVYPSAQIGCTFPFENQLENSLPYAETYASAYREHKPHGGRILIDNYYCNYYLNCEAMSIFSNAANEIRHAQTLEELTAALDREHIDAILITNDFISIYWADTVLYQLVNTSEYQAIGYGFFTVYQKIS